MQKKTVALTGSSGNMGFQGFLELYARKDKFNIVLLVRDSKKNRKKFAKYLGDPAVRFVWGDLTNYEDVLNMVGARIMCCTWVAWFLLRQTITRPKRRIPI